MIDTNEKMTYETPKVQKLYMSSEGMLCASQWDADHSEMTYEKYEW